MASLYKRGKRYWIGYTLNGERVERSRAKPQTDKYARAHVKVRLLEDLSPELINCFLSARIEHDAWSAKTVNLMRQVIHRLFSYAIKHYAALIPEAMHDSVEFEPAARDEPKPDDTRELLENILKEVSGKPEEPSDEPRLRVVRG